MKNSATSLVDVILALKSWLCFNAYNLGCEISDWHNMIDVVVKGSTAKAEKRRANYRSFKNFDQVRFNEDIGKIRFQWAYLFDDIYWGHDMFFPRSTLNMLLSGTEK